MRAVLLPPSLDSGASGMSSWSLKEDNLKKYPHFDPVVSVADAQALATDPKRVAEHTFYPFMRYLQRWNRFAKKGEQGKPKERPIRYAARRDAYIYSYYRHQLAERYEPELKRLGLDDSVLAYRRISVPGRTGGKCNIHFAYDAVLKIRELGNCCVVALDISSFFEHLDHVRLRALWCRLLGERRLPRDHFKVFERITRYSIVDKQRVYERLGHFGAKRTSKTGKPINGYLTPYRDIPRQLCTGTEFRQKIVPLIETNQKPYGIPQGAPISDLLANIYLIDFDSLALDWIRPLGGAYYRYSDDILFIVPGGEAVGRELMERARSTIWNFGRKLVIKEEKSSLFVFARDGDDQTVTLVHGIQGRNGLEYLGFRYDGKRVFLRDSTLANLHRKVARAARRDATVLAKRYPDKNAEQLRSLFNYERLISQFGRVEDFGEKQRDYRNWTFWTYARRASEIFGPLGKPILRQLRRHRDLIRNRANKEIDSAVARRSRHKA
jgi:hypothetical protein